MTQFQLWLQQLGLPRLDFDIDEYSRGKIMRASILPFVVFSAILTRLALDIVFGQISVVPSILYSEVPKVPDFWWRIYKLASGLVQLEWVALASLVFAGMFRWTRNEATWMLVIGSALAAIASVAVVYVAISYVAFDDGQSLLDVRVFSVSAIAAEFGILSIGYLFIAYRGLAVREPRRRLRRARRPAPSPSFQRPAPGPNRPKASTQHALQKRDENGPAGARPLAHELAAAVQPQRLRRAMPHRLPRLGLGIRPLEGQRILATTSCIGAPAHQSEDIDI